jgi:cytochrome c-type biogenesis protein CcmH/NrfF
VPAAVHAQHVETGQTVPVIARSGLERELQQNLICMCGTCGRQLLSQCQCGYAQKMRAELATLITAGRTREQVIDYYIAKYGSQEPLAQPIDEGFNRLAWAVPYMLGATGLLVTGLVAVRWTRRGATARAADLSATDRNAPGDPALESRLNDELSNLD